MLTPDEAADIARAAGLGVADAVAIRALADDTATATRIAKKFAESDDTRTVRHLFGRAEVEEPTPLDRDPATAGVVPSEGGPVGDPPPPDESRDFIRNIFQN